MMKFREISRWAQSEGLEGQIVKDAGETEIEI